MKGSVAAWLRGAVIIGAALSVLWSDQGVSAAQPEPPLDQIVLITIDTLRADHVGSYGYPRPTTPFLDRLAAEGVLFKRAFTSMATTTPALASILTSLYPIQTKLLNNGHLLRDEFNTMAELMRQRGYKTAAFVSQGRNFGPANMDQGFDHYDEPEDLGPRAYRPAEETVGQALDWLQQRPQTEPLFLWIHLFDPHAPLQPTPELLQKFRGENANKREELRRLLVDKHGLYPDHLERHAKWAEKKLGTRDFLEAIDRYDAEIRRADDQLERLHRALGKLLGDRKSLWIVTADHGEGLTAHQWWAHGKHIYNEQLQVPLIFHFSFGDYRGRTVDRLVETVDILPTLLEIVGIREWEQRGAVQGISLLGLLDGEDGRYNKNYAFAQRREFNARNARKKRKSGDAEELRNFEAGEKFALQNGSFKLIHHTAGPDEFYALRGDPYERNNISGKGFSEETELRKLLFNRIDLLQGTGDEGPLSVDKQTIEGLRGLGYVQ